MNLTVHEGQMAKELLAEDNTSALKHAFDRQHLARLARAISKHSNIETKLLTKNPAELEPLEMKARVHLVRERLREVFPQKTEAALALVEKVALDSSLRAFDLWPLSEFVSKYGLLSESKALKVLQKMTMVFTSEWAVRPYLAQSTDATLQFLFECTKNKEAKVRRWASEGSRPKLPWGSHFAAAIENPKITAAILDALKYDEDLYVKKSVANHLNDIAKDHPDYVVDVLAKWKKEAATRSTRDLAQIEWIIRHSLRTLIKAGHPEALLLIGVAKKMAVEVGALRLSKKKLKVGDAFEFSFDLKSKSKVDQKLVIDYLIHFTKKDGKTKPKVLKFKTIHLKAGETLTLTKKHVFRQVTTRVFYSGVHKVELQINGNLCASANLHLSV